MINVHMNKQNIDNQSLEDMINLLQQYEKMCLEKEDFSSADQAKNKISFLKTQKLVLKKQQLQNQDKQNMQTISKQGQQEVRLFQQHWEEELQNLIQTLKEIQNSLNQQHQQQIIEYQMKLDKQNIPKIKYSSPALEMRRYLKSLIRVKNYKQAQIVKNNLQVREKEQDERWLKKFQQKKKAKIQTIKRKQQNQLKALRVRLQATFNQKLKQRDHKFQILLKKNRKRRIQSGKVSRQRLRAKTNLLNESKTFSISKY